MTILKIFKTIKISVKRILNNLIERCTVLLAAFVCVLGTILSVIDVVIEVYGAKRRMDQAPPPPNNQDLQDAPEHQDPDDGGIDMIVDGEEDDDFDDEIDLDEELELEEEMENLDESSDSEHMEPEMNINIGEIPAFIKLSDWFIYKPLELNCSSKKPIYLFKPFNLIRDKFLDKNIADVPAARSGHRIIASDSNLYSLGGYNPRSALTAARDGRCMLFQELWCYNFATRRWKLRMNGDNMPNMPRELASNALVMYNNVLISHGGTGYPFGESCSNDCYVYTTGDKPLLARLNVSGDLPAPLYGPAIVIHDDYLYTIGGTTGFDYACDVYRLNLKTRVWESMYISRPEMRDDPEGRYRHEIVYDGKYIYVLGGGTSLNVYDLQRIPAFNLNTNRWEFFDTLPDRTVIREEAALAAEGPNLGFPKPRKCFTCVQHKMDNGDIEAFITGGLQGDFNTYFADVWKLNLRTMQWSIIRTAALPKALYFHSAADTGHGCMYIFGGIEYDEKEMRRRNRVYKMWMTIPKLSEMCWDAITYYNDYLCTYNSKELLAYGVPKRFVERVEFLPKPCRYGTVNPDEGNPSSMACTSL